MKTLDTKILLLIFFLFISTSCSTFQKMGIGATADIFYRASAEMETESNFENFKMAVPPQLKMLEGLLSLKPEDQKLQITLIKGYAAYAFSVNETLYLNDYYQDNDESVHRLQGIYNYSRALKHGQAWLEQEGVAYSDLQKAANKKMKIAQLLKKALGEDPVALEGIIFTAQALAGLINFQKNNMSLVSQLPIAKSMFDYACGINPRIGQGICQMFSGAYETGRPRMLGGNPEKGKKIFQELIKDQPHNWLARVAYMQFYLIPQADEEGYKKQKFFLDQFKHLAKDEMKWNPSLKEKKNAAFQEPKIRFYQTLAIERYNIILKYENDLF